MLKLEASWMGDVDDPSYHLGALATLEEADLALGRVAERVTEEPHTIDAVTREWIHAVIGKSVPGAALISLTAGRGHDGMTERRKWRLEWNAEGRAADLPQRIFVKATPADVYHRETLAVMHMGYTEVNFYEQIQPSISGITPKGYYGRAYPGGRYILLLEDLEVRGLQPFWMGDYCSPAHAKAVAAAMAEYHALYWESSRFYQDLSWIRPKSRRYGRFWHAAGLHEDRIKFLDTELASDLSEDLRDFVHRYNDNVFDLHRYYDTLPPTLLHGDSHLGNSFATPDGRAGMFDWQLVFRGPAYRDLAYFVYSALTIEDRQAHETSIFDHYMDALQDRGVTPDRGQAWRDYCLLLLERWDGVFKTPLHGYFGHDPKAYQRQARSIHSALVEHDVNGLMRHALAKI